MCNTCYFLIERNGWDRVFWRSIDELIWIHKIDKCIRFLIVESDDSDFFKENTGTLVPDFFSWFDRFLKIYLSCLSTGNWCIARIGCESESSADTPSLCSTIKTGNSSNFWIWDCTDLDRVIGSQEFERGIDRPNIIGLHDRYFPTCYCRGRRVDTSLLTRGTSREEYERRDDDWSDDFHRERLR